MLDGIISKLRAFGITEGEIKVYIAALELGPSPVADLANAVKLSKQAVYNAVTELSERGLMTSFENGRTKLHAAEPPAKLLQYIERRSEELQTVVADLADAVHDLEMRAGQGKPAVKMYEGKEAIISATLEVLIGENGEVREIVDLNALERYFSKEDLRRIFSSLKRTGRQATGIYAGTESHIARYGMDRCVLLSAEDAGFEAVVGLLSDRIIFISLGDKSHSVIVKSEPFVRALHILFKHAHAKLQNEEHAKVEIHQN